MTTPTFLQERQQADPLAPREDELLDLGQIGDFAFEVARRGATWDSKILSHLNSLCWMAAQSLEAKSQAELGNSIDEARDEAHAEGHDEGWEDGYREGRENGLAEGGL